MKTTDEWMATLTIPGIRPPEPLRDLVEGIREELITEILSVARSMTDIQERDWSRERHLGGRDVYYAIKSIGHHLGLKSLCTHMGSTIDVVSNRLLCLYCRKEL